MGPCRYLAVSGSEPRDSDLDWLTIAKAVEIRSLIKGRLGGGGGKGMGVQKLFWAW